MTHYEHAPDICEQECREAVDWLLARYGWQLMSREDFTRRTLAHLCSGATADPRRAAIYTYSHALYHACSGQAWASQQQLGYRELFRYLYDSAHWRYAAVCDEVTQHAIESIYGSFERCPQPGAFLAFAFQHLSDAASKLRRQKEQEQQLPMFPTRTGAIRGIWLLDQWQDDPYEEVVASKW